MMMNSPAHKSIAETFENLRARRHIALMPFVSAGYPDLQTTAATLQAIEQAGANLIEIGFPFSDPIADGPVIQESYTEALKKNLKLADIFAMIGQVRPTVSIPLVGMVSYSVVFRYGVPRFLTNAKMSGLNGLIIPDLPPPEAQSVCEQIRSAGLDTILLVAPTSTPQRRAEIAALCSGFVYYLSVSGTTGERKDLPTDLRENVTKLKQTTKTPVCVGFGISKPEHVRQLADIADGAIVGTAVVRRMKEHLSQGSAEIANAVGAYCRELLSLVI